MSTIENVEKGKSGRDRRRDRTARLLKLQILLWQNRDGLKIEEIARRCSVSKRTIYRDLQAIESELGVPIWEDGPKRGIVEGYVLPPIPFTLPEALNIFLSARLMQYYSRRYDPNMASTFVKLNSVVPSPLREQIQKTIDWLNKQPRIDKQLFVLGKLAEAWVSQHQVRIRYKALSEEEPTERVIEPYFIEPAAPGHSSYVIAYSHRVHAVRTFKIERIEDIQILSETYAIPPDFDAIDYLSSSWGIVVDGEVVTIKMKFSPRVARIIAETVWHTSQILEPQSDGALIMILNVTNTIDLRAWILGWGEEVEVLEPVELRESIIKTTKALLGVYSKKH
ncbi:MAG TPA: transcriptional regulator [Desulfosporosinus sp.]|nr:transcriptional regulator [Desulfosporosinus sp.]